jgi:hypothetical protein
MSYFYDLKTKIPIPSSIENILVFPLDRTTHKFTNIDNLPTRFEEKTSLHEINQVLTQLNDQTVQLPSRINVLLVSLLIIFLPWPYLIYEMATWTTAYPIWSWIIYGVYFVFGTTFYVKFLRDKLNKAKTESGRIIEKQQEMFISKGMRWQLPEYFPLWIELHNNETDRYVDISTLDSNRQKTEQDEPNSYQPPNMYP